MAADNILDYRFTNSSTSICSTTNSCASVGILLGSLLLATGLAVLMRCAAQTDYKRWRKARAAIASEGPRTALLATRRGANLGAVTAPTHRRNWSAPPRLPSMRSTPPPQGELRLSWEELSYKVGRQEVLQPNSGSVTPGLWIMIGPSGAGKSTHLGVLAGRKAHGTVGGSVRLNGARASPAARRALVGYVTQDDVLPGTSTVAEYLHFHAQLRLPWLASSERALLIARTLACLQVRDLPPHLPISPHISSFHALLLWPSL